MTDAERLSLSYPADLSEWGRTQLRTPWFRAYLRKTVETPVVGQHLEEFLDVGCCGSSLDVILRIESIDGGDELGPDTEIEYVDRSECSPGVRPEPDPV